MIFFDFLICFFFDFFLIFNFSSNIGRYGIVSVHNANGTVRGLPENFGGNVSQPCRGVPQFGLDQGNFLPMSGWNDGGGQQHVPTDVFAKSEKWIGKPTNA